MSKTADAVTVGATVASAAAAHTVYGTIGVILMGAAWGALFAVFKSPPMARFAGFKFMMVRGLPAMAFTWILTLALQHFLGELVDAEQSWTALLLCIAFFIASPSESSELLRELLSSVWKLRKAFAKVKE